MGTQNGNKITANNSKIVKKILNAIAISYNLLAEIQNYPS